MTLPSFTITEPVVVEIDEEQMPLLRPRSLPMSRVEMAAQACTPEALSFRCGDIAVVTRSVSVERSWLRLDIDIFVQDRPVPFDNPVYFANPPVGVIKRLYKVRGNPGRLLREVEIDPVTAIRSALVYFVWQYVHARPDFLHRTRNV